MHFDGNVVSLQTIYVHAPVRQRVDSLAARREPSVTGARASAARRGAFPVYRRRDGVAILRRRMRHGRVAVLRPEGAE